MISLRLPAIGLTLRLPRARTLGPTGHLREVVGSLAHLPVILRARLSEAGSTFDTRPRLVTPLAVKAHAEAS